jgi:hypothetical protein
LKQAMMLGPRTLVCTDEIVAWLESAYVALLERRRPEIFLPSLSDLLDMLLEVDSGSGGLMKEHGCIERLLVLSEEDLLPKLHAEVDSVPSEMQLACMRVCFRHLEYVMQADCSLDGLHRLLCYTCTLLTMRMKSGCLCAKSLSSSEPTLGHVDGCCCAKRRHGHC